jgi:hypothetical protein
MLIILANVDRLACHLYQVDVIFEEYLYQVDVIFDLFKNLYLRAHCCLLASSFLLKR